MPISFHCETCRRSVCVPDGSEGKKTRCPECYSIVRIPFTGNTTLLTVPDEPEFAPPEVDDPLGITGKTESRWDAPVEDQTTPNPFAAAVPSPQPPTQPPATSDQEDVAARHQTTLSNLTSGLMVMGGIILLGMLLNLFFRITSFVDRPFPAPETIAQLAMSTLIAFVQLATIMALNEARMLRKYSTARVGMIMAIIPFCNPAMCLGLPLVLAIWGLVLIARSDVRAAFESEQSYTPD